MNIESTKDLGEIIRNVRRSQKLTQVQLATFAGTGERFIVDLEKGKETCELSKALRVATMLGIKIEVIPPT